MSRRVEGGRRLSSARRRAWLARESDELGAAAVAAGAVRADPASGAAPALSEGGCGPDLVVG